jgi:hypothetical protein
VTVVFELPVTTAWNCCVAPSTRLAPGGVTVTLTLDEPLFGGLKAIPQLMSAIAITQNIPSATALGQFFLRQEIAAARAPDCFSRILLP